MADMSKNPQTENDENVVYEYVELEEGQELPEGYEYEYEYVEVAEGGNEGVSELDVVSQKTDDVPDEETELASAAEIEAVLSPRNLEAEIEGTSVPVPVQELPATPKPEPIVAEEQKMPQIEAPGSEADLDKLLNDLQEPKFDMLQAEEIAEDVPLFEADVTEQEKEESGIPALDTLLSAVESDISADTDGAEEETVTTVAEENAFVLPEDIKFQNSDDDDEPKDWFDQSHLKSGAEVGSVDIDAFANTVAENVSDPQNAAEQPDLSRQEVTVDKPVAEDAALAEITDLLSEMNAEIRVPEKISGPTAISEEIILPEVSEEVVAPVVEAAVPAVDVEPALVENGADASNDISIDDLLNENSVLEVDALTEIEPVEEGASESVVEETKEISAAVQELNEEAEPVAVEVQPAAAIIDTAQEREDIINPLIELPKVMDCSADLFAVKALAARLVSKNDGIQSFKGTEAVNALALNDVDFKANELNAWNLVLFKQEIVPLTAKVSELELPRNSQVNRFASLVKAGEQKAEFFNEDKLKILNTTDSCVAVQGRFVCGDLQTNSGLIINDMLTLPLRDFAGKELSFGKPASGLLSGPNGTLLYFFNLLSLLVPNEEAAETDAEKLQYKISKWYSGSLNDKYFEFNAQSPSGSFEGNDEIKAIHVNVNNSSYGWNVAFDNGLSMNLRDLREYQTRFGKMPSPNGVISYGQTKLTFSNVERIVVYESAQYYFYS